MSAPQKTDDKRITPEFLAQAGKGRPKGVQNKTTRAIKEMVIAALDKAGGVDYLVKQSEQNPTAFLALVGKVLPLDVNANITTQPPAYTVDDWVIPSAEIGHA